MRTVELMFKGSAGLEQFAKNYFSYLSGLLNALDLVEIKEFAAHLDKARLENRTIFFAGNGGSAATASHMANDLGTDTRKYTNTPNPFRALALTDNNAVMLAVANDDGYEHIFTNQLKVHFRKGDVLVAISASGNSANLLKAAQWVKEQGGVVLALVGFDGGALRSLADVSILVKTPKGQFGPVEDVHMIMDHLLANWFQHKIRQQEQKS